MFKRLLVVLAFILPVPLCNTVLASEATEQRELAVTVNDSPVLELFRSENGRFFYELNDAWLLGMSMGISPLNLTYDSSSITQRATHFSLYELRRSPSQQVTQTLPAGKNKISWFWTFGPTQDYSVGPDVSGNVFNVQLDFLSRFSLQTKAGFVLPFGKQWLFGGGILVERGIGYRLQTVLPGTNPDKWETSLGTYFGLKFSY